MSTDITINIKTGKVTQKESKYKAQAYTHTDLMKFSKLITKLKTANVIANESEVQ